ncbi:MAG TPA: bifunctional folylpolyglutamate synthase/dihydrofolate synthase [Chloroflexi bacterium]|nr:bifunctional folylpolyglutamate synthase/dihydrofolate synthase [Chloroflexota bacterium]
MQPISAYKQALNYIYSHTNFERKQMPKYDMTTLDLSRVTTLLEKLDNPHHQYPALLIAGTKGKGSTAAMSDSIIRAAGYKTGLYTSPHLHSFRERIKMDGELISEADVVELVRQMRPYVDPIAGITAWEIMTALAFLAFARAGVDLAVLEVGLGGRLDATNVSKPSVSVITSISYDHTHLLGNTFPLIAREKAGIIKQQGLVVSAPQYPEAMTEIEAVCREKDARLIVVGDEVSWRVGRVSLDEQIVYRNGQAYAIPLLGRHQAVNAITALTAVEALQSKTDLRFSDEAKKEGLAAVRWPGRLEILNKNPMFIVDSAMNGDSARKLRQTLSDYFPGRNLILIFGSSGDHHYSAMLKELLPYADRVIATQANHPRSTSPEILAAVAQTMDRMIETAPTVAQALDMALAKAEERDLICVAGSLFCAAEARYVWAEKGNFPLPPTDPI